MLQKNGSISSDAGTSNCSLSRGELFLVCVYVCACMCVCVWRGHWIGAGGRVSGCSLEVWMGGCMCMCCLCTCVHTCGVCLLMEGGGTFLCSVCVFIHVVYVCVLGWPGGVHVFAVC